MLTPRTKVSVSRRLSAFAERPAKTACFPLLAAKMPNLRMLGILAVGLSIFVGTFVRRRRLEGTLHGPRALGTSTSPPTSV